MCVGILEGSWGLFLSPLQGDTSPVCPLFGQLSGYPAEGAKGPQTSQVQEGCGSKSKVYAPMVRKFQILCYRVCAKGKMQTLAFCYFALQGFRDLLGVISLGGNVVPMQPNTLTLTFLSGELGSCRTYPWVQNILWPQLWPRKMRLSWFVSACVLVSAGMEIIFFFVDVTAFYFGIHTGIIMLITH